MNEEIVEDNQVDTAEPESNESEQEQYEEEQYEDDYSEEAEETPAESEDDGNEDLEFNSKAYRVPKDVAEAVRSMQKDYTQKTMSLSEQRKAFETQSRFQQEYIQDIAKVTAMDERIAEFNQVDWNRLSDEDPVLWQKLFSQKNILENQRGQLAQNVAQKQHEVALSQQQEIAKQIEASESVLKREIKDWSPQLESSLQEFAVAKLGFDISDVKQSKADPRLYKLLHMAYLGNQIMSKQVAKPKVVQQAKPVTVLQAKNTRVGKDPTQMNDAEFAKWRKQQIQKRGNS